MASNLSDSRSECVNKTFDRFLSKSINKLLEFENIFSQEVKSNFKSEEQMFNFVKQLFIKFANIGLLNAFAVRFLVF